MTSKKQFFSCLLALVMLASMAVIGAPAASAAEAADQVDVDQQLDFIRSQTGKLIQKDTKNTWYYAVTDLDHDGNLEFVAASQHPADRSTNLKVWEVSKDGKALTECKLEKEEDESFPDILTDCADTFHDLKTDTWNYLLNDNIVLSDTEVYTIKTSVKLKDGVISYEPYAVEHTVLEGGWRTVSHTDANGFEISDGEYNAAGISAFVDADRSSTSFEWLTDTDAKDLAHLSDSYAVFMGRKAPTEVFPVPKPAALQEPAATLAPAATPIPVVTPVPVQEVAPTYLSITKNPTNENKKVGATALFVACANAFDSLDWTFVSPDGGEYSVQQVAYMWADAPISGYYGTTLSIGNVARDMNGWGAYCTFYYRGQVARTSTAYMYVNGEDPTPTPTQGEGGVFYGSVSDWNGSTVSVNLDGTTYAALPWGICSVSGDIYVGAPATVSWSGKSAQGPNYTYCYIEGSQPEPVTQYGSMSGLAYEGGGGFAIDLANGTQVYVDGWKCGVSGKFYDGASCIVYYTDYPSGANIYEVSIFGREDASEVEVYEDEIYEEDDLWETGFAVLVDDGDIIYEVPTHECYNEDGSTYSAIWCPDCGAEVSLAMENCPNCGREF